MIRTNGQLFHIDFGFIFGRDPKPLPPPFRFTRHMADAMGGEESDHYKKFQSYCCQAYNWLRKSANLILNLLSLMVDAGIPDLSVRQDPAIVLKKVEEKFRLDLTGQPPPPLLLLLLTLSSAPLASSDELAEAFFLGLINDSLTALAPRLMEIAHQISVARR
jgi:phosphatidylinositol 3-kinase